MNSGPEKPASAVFADKQRPHKTRSRSNARSRIGVYTELTPFHNEKHMQVLLHTDTHVDGRQGMAEHLETVVKEALHRFGDHVTRVEAHVTDAAHHNKPNPDDIHCTLEARLTGLEPVIVKEAAPNAHQAIQGAVVKLKRAVASTIEKHDTRRHPRPEADDSAE